MTNDNNKKVKNEVDSLFAKANYIGKEMATQIPGGTLLLGIYRIIKVQEQGRRIPHGEIVFKWGASCIKTMLSGVVRDCPPCSTVAFVKRNSEANSEYDVFGAGRSYGDSLIQHFAWEDFIESDGGSLINFCKSGGDQITLRNPRLLLFSTAAVRNFIISSDDVIAYISSRRCHSSNGELCEISIIKLFDIRVFDKEVKPLFKKFVISELAVDLCPKESQADIEIAINAADAIQLEAELIKADIRRFKESFLDHEEVCSSHIYALARCLYECLSSSYKVDKTSKYPLQRIYDSIHGLLPEETMFTTKNNVKSFLDDNNKIFTHFEPTFEEEGYGLSESVITYAKANSWEKAIPEEAILTILSNAANKQDANESQPRLGNIFESPSHLGFSREDFSEGRPYSTDDDGEKREEQHDKPQETTMTEEKEAIISFWEKLKDAGWHYSLRDIVRFHTSVKTGALTILAGASGTGKSSLFKLYSKFITGTSEFAQEKDDSCNGLWKRVNVVSTWMEPSDLLGWNNPMAKEDSDPFNRAPGGLFDFLEHITSASEKKMSLLCFEEMNLAQAELYFSDFLQAISESSGNRKIINPKGGSFEIPNLRIIGTCNIDHTTKPFTERFLDRCNYINLAIPDDGLNAESFFPDKLPDDNIELPSYNAPFCPSKTIPKKIMDELKRWPPSTEKDNWKGFVDAINELGLYPSPRVRMSMLEYIAARPSLGDDGVDIGLAENIRKGLDEAISQRILTKLLLRNDWDRGDRAFTKTMNDLYGLLNADNLTLSKLFVETELAKSSKANI